MPPLVQYHLDRAAVFAVLAQARAVLGAPSGNEQRRARHRLAALSFEQQAVEELALANCDELWS